MEIKLDKQMSDYKLVFFQPEPETGERICIGLLFSDPNGKRQVLYDNEFSRVRCFAPSFELGLLRFLMRSLEDQIRGASDRSDEILRGFGSQVSLSSPHQTAPYLPESVKLRLLERFVTKRQASPERISILASAEKSNNDPAARFAAHLREFAQPILAARQGFFFEMADSRQIFGRKVSGLGRVSLAVVLHEKVTLLDGVDLSLQTPQEVIQRTTKVAHTFWQYKNYEADLISPKRIDRVALIFNGKSKPGSKYLDAQGFARDILSKASEFVLEHDGPSDLLQLESILST